MSLYDNLQEKLKTALLNRHMARVEVLKLVKSSILLKAKESSQAIPSDDICQACIYKQIKNYQQTIDLCRSRGRLEVVEQKTKEIEILQDLLPPQLSEADLVKIVDQVLTTSELPKVPRNLNVFIKQVEGQTGLRASRQQIVLLLKKKIGF